MLIKIVFSAFVCVSLAFVCFSQTTDDYKKNEFYIGYSALREDGSSDNGFEVSATRNVSRYFGFKGDFSYAFRNRTYGADAVSGAPPPQSSFRTHHQIYNFLGGVQIKDNRAKTRFKPFAHALAGIGYGRFTNIVQNCASASNCSGFIDIDSSAGFSVAVGGGLDIRVNDKIDFRAIQVDYNPIYFDNGFRNNLRFGIGIVFH